MKTLITTLLILSSISTAYADGFKCEGVNSGVNVDVFNYTQPAAGTRNPAIMVVSNSYVNSPNKTIATFSGKHSDGTLQYLGLGLYEAKVDLRRSESNRKGENIAGTKLGQLDAIRLEIFTTHRGEIVAPRMPNDVMKNGETTDARLYYLKRNGEILEEKAICKRYLKN